MSINFVSLPSVRLITLNDVLRLGVFGHLVEGDFVGVVKDNKVVKLLVGSEASGFSGDSLLEASISSKSEDVVVEDLVLISVVASGGHLLGNGESDGVGDSGSERSSGAFNSGGGVLRVGELRMSGSLGVVLTEVLELVDGEIESSEVQPGVKEHRSMSSRKDESVAVNPSGVLGIVLHLGSVKSGSNLSTSKGKTHVSRVCGSDGVHCKTTGLIGSGGKSSHLVDLSGGIGHLEAGRLADTEGGARGGGESVHTGGESRGGNSKHGEFHLEIGWGVVVDSPCEIL
mmetsp:Transcript_4707/g.9941  ORF Transcript_4707/g.9941 Transcript_4707/m.9941 type:complete len:286 (-) Transcript_4707:92-949(-)